MKDQTLNPLAHELAKRFESCKKDAFLTRLDGGNSIWSATGQTNPVVDYTLLLHLSGGQKIEVVGNPSTLQDAPISILGDCGGDVTDRLRFVVFQGEEPICTHADVEKACFCAIVARKGATQMSATAFIIAKSNGERVSFCVRDETEHRMDFIRNIALLMVEESSNA